MMKVNHSLLVMIILSLLLKSKALLSIQRKGQYAIIIILNQAGKHEIHIKYQDQPIKNSPILLNIAENKLLASRDPKTVPNQPKFIIGQKGFQIDANGQFSGPSGLCINSKGEIIVADYYNHLIQIFNSEGNYLSKFG